MPPRQAPLSGDPATAQQPRRTHWRLTGYAVNPLADRPGARVGKAVVAAPDREAGHHGRPPPPGSPGPPATAGGAHPGDPAGPATARRAPGRLGWRGPGP